METKDLNNIYRCFRWLATAVVTEYHENEQTSGMKIKTHKFFDSIEKFIEWDKLERDDFLTLGFMNISDYDDEYDLWLLPAWMYDIIPNGFKLYDSNMNEFFFNRNTTPFEQQYGCLKYGIRRINETAHLTLDEMLEGED